MTLRAACTGRTPDVQRPYARRAPRVQHLCRQSAGLWGKDRDIRAGGGIS